jgi:hypothetical protein
MSREPNAFAIFHPQGNVIALNVVLEPLLKHLNGVFMWFLDLAYSGTPIRTSSLIMLLFPAILYFAHDLPVQRLPMPCLLSAEDARYAKWLTVDQIKFVVAHEMGHIFLGHNRADTRCDMPPSALGPGTPHVAYYSRDHAMEFDADCFALNYAKTSFMNDPVVQPVTLKRFTELDRKRGVRRDWRQELGRLLKRTRPDPAAPVHGYGRFRAAAEILFLIFRLLEEGSAALDDTLRGTTTPTAPRTHPAARQRLERIREFNTGDLQPDVAFVEFVASVVDKMLATMRRWTPDDARTWAWVISEGGSEAVSKILTQRPWPAE